VDAAQGFLFSPAVPAEAFEALGRRPFHPLGS
jgi:EAL domain-containing protein (putative c-di-GMP-specific phosphodiesterase class I)